MKRLHLLIPAALISSIAAAAPASAQEQGQQTGQAPTMPKARVPANLAQSIAPDMLCKRVKISFVQAERIAQARTPGRTEEIELERGEDGKLLYTVEITHAGAPMEVSIDATSGQILKVEAQKPEESESGAAPNQAGDASKPQQQ